MATREAVEAQVLRGELAVVEDERASFVPQLVSLAAQFSPSGGRKLGLLIDGSCVVTRIVPKGLADEEGSLRIGDKIVAVNSASTREPTSWSSSRASTRLF